MNRKAVQWARKFTNTFGSLDGLHRPWALFAGGLVFLSQVTAAIHSLQYDDAPDESVAEKTVKGYEGDIQKISALPAEELPAKSNILAATILKDRRLSEEDIKSLSYSLADVVNKDVKRYEIPALSDFAFVRECEARVPANADIPQLHACMKEMDKPYKDTHFAMTAVLAGSIPVLGIFGLAATGMRRRVRMAEQEIKVRDFSKSVEDLRRVVTPRKER